MGKCNEQLYRELKNAVENADSSGFERFDLKVSLKDRKVRVKTVPGPSGSSLAAWKKLLSD
jgi:hypothetical protein